MRLVVGLLAIIAILVGLFQLRDASEGLAVTRSTVGETPITIFKPRSDGAVPVVVIAHGFAGSQQLMQPFAQTLAQNGYIAVTFDFLGHGRNPLPMRGDVTEGETVTAALLRELTDVTASVRRLPGSDGRIAVLGHSMASDIVVRFAQANPDVNPMKLFFLAIIAPAILLLFLAFGVISRWSYAATHHPLPGALANAAVFAWGIAVTFPMIVR